MNKLKQQEFKECRAGKKANEKEAIKLREYWGYNLGYEYTIRPDITGFDVYFTITSENPKEYGW